MKNKIIDSISIIPKSRYEPNHSLPLEKKFVFSYTIRIKNESNRPIQLLSRYWNIQDSNNRVKEVSGDGIIGKQPIIMPGEFFEYDSWSPLGTELGVMKGAYTIYDLQEGALVRIPIPPFKLIADFKLN